MKKTIAIISAVFILSGCSLLDAYKTSKFDGNEYFSVNQIRTIAEIAEPYCDTGTIDYSLIRQIYVSSSLAVNYTQYLPENEDSHELLKGLHTLIVGFKTQYDNKGGKISKAYCNLKLNSIKRSAEKIQQVIGSKSR